MRLEKKRFLVIPVPIDIGTGMADQRIIDGFSHVSTYKS